MMVEIPNRSLASFRERYSEAVRNKADPGGIANRIERFAYPGKRPKTSASESLTLMVTGTALGGVTGVGVEKDGPV